MELFQLLLREVEVWPFDPTEERPPASEGEFTTKIRAHFVPGADLFISASECRSG